MKTIKLSPIGYTKVFASLLLVVTFSCTDIDPEGVTSPGPAVEPESWETLLDPEELASSIIVNNKSSIQDAVDAALPGDVIYIEPGVYKETVSIDKNNIKLIGLARDHTNERVIVDNVRASNSHVEFVNIQSRNSADISGRAWNEGRKGRGITMSREQLTDNIAHYEFEIRMGSGEFEVVRIHRVVREYRKYRPIRTKGDVFMIHGASQDFEDIFLYAGSTNPDGQTSSPIFLAKKGIDVWGIDLAWTLVPVETSDFTFMKDWGVKRDVNHVLAAMSIARLIRGLTGQGFGRINLLGFSYGVAVAYAAAGYETQQYSILRDIKGLIQVDGAMKYASTDDAHRLSVCAEADNIKSLINGGQYQTTLGVQFPPFGAFAQTAPNDASPIIPGMTNYQAGLFVGTSTYALGNNQAPFWHFMGGDQNAPAAIPTTLQYSDPARWFTLLQALAPYQPQRTGLDYRICLCDEEESSLDDHLSEISVPILYLGAGGGLGSLGEYTSSLTGSTDITHYVADQQPDDLRFIDYGHADLWMADNASELVWEVLRQWLLDHHGLYNP